MGTRGVSLFLTLQLVFAWPSLACTLTGYDIGSLSAASYWMFDVPPLYCLDVGAASCKFYFSICKQLPPEICGEGISVCEKNFTTNGNFTAYAASNYTYMQSGAGFVFRWIGGNFSNCSTTVAFQCSPNAQWTHSNVTSYRSSYTRDPANACNISVSMVYAGACLATPTSTVHTSPPRSRANNYRKLALVVTVAVVCILLSVALFYLVVGVIFQAAIKKERGIRVLPNYDFWCSVFTSVLCCGRAGKDKAKYDRFSQEPDEGL